jgi:transcriptional regulator with GAF, ATPase, and Fis domain
LDIAPGAEINYSTSKTLEDVERSYIARILEETNWVIHGKRGAASVLGMNSGTLRSRMKKLGIKKSLKIIINILYCSLPLAT